MSNKGTNIPDAETKTDKDIGFEYNELLAELTAEYKVELLQPGDVTASMLSDSTGKSINATRTFLEGKAKSGQLVRVRVHSGHGVQWAYRKP